MNMSKKLILITVYLAISTVGFFKKFTRLPKFDTSDVGLLTGETSIIRRARAQHRDG